MTKTQKTVKPAKGTKRAKPASKPESALKTLLTAHKLSANALGVGANLSRGAVHRLVVGGQLPVRDPEAAQRITGWLASWGVPAAEMENLFPQQQKLAPDVRQHAEAVPEAPTAIEDTQEEFMLLRNEPLTVEARKHFGLARSPFHDDVRTRADVFASGNTRYVRAALLDAALNHGFMAFVGESGAGKSTLVEELEERIVDEGRQVIVIRPYVVAMEADDVKGRSLKSSAIAEAIIRTLDPAATPKSSHDALYRQLHELLKASRAAGYSHMLIIEEAHCLPKATLKHLKRFLELKQGLGRLLGICLVGQPELLTLLSDRSPEVREVVQRCEIVELMPLDNDLGDYLRHKFDRMGAKYDDVFTDDACDAIRAKLIRVPRGGTSADAHSLCFPLVVNNLVARAMNAAALSGWEKVDAQVIGGC